jgi:hypothetical protein
MPSPQKPGPAPLDIIGTLPVTSTDAGASLRELMDRMGHSSTRAALIYQHPSDERQRKLADAVGEAALKTATSSGTHVAREASGQS